MKLFQVTCSGAILAAGLFLSTGCATQRTNDDLSVLLRRTQQDLADRELTISQLKSEIERLRTHEAGTTVAALQGAGDGEELESRLSELQQRIDSLGRPLQDIERFSVEGGYVLMVQDKILFDSGSADISTEGKKALDKVAAEIDGQPHGKIWVRGHTDSDQVSKPATKERFPHGNLQLSAARAVEVAAQLIASKKVKASDVAVAGFGPHDPVKPNNSAENKRMNRRVEIFVADRNATKAAAPANAPKN